MARWLVAWEMDDEESVTPVEAARRAWEAMRRDGSTANVFTVIDVIAETRYLVDLSEPRVKAERLPNVWTVLGVWDDDEPVPTGAVRGDHDVRGDPDYVAYPQGFWATSAEAETADEAIAACVQEMRDTLDA